MHRMPDETLMSRPRKDKLMVKKLRYPRKLRQTLERVREGAEERVSQDEPPVPPDFATHWQAFLRPGSVAIMMARLDGELNRLVTAYHLCCPDGADMVAARAPWVDNVTREVNSREPADPP
jgi:hypothetical protein